MPMSAAPLRRSFASTDLSSLARSFEEDEYASPPAIYLLPPRAPMKRRVGAPCYAVHDRRVRQRPSFKDLGGPDATIV
ncbi:hypothetical protein H257_15080 [Aphanomyces astaci]|uniref:Uncharacterized protein n=1 Tax=Aphanomyces astaci TaxID=112090 RepID=W4FR47_APHAT|nr:hypothetical protein H257_15080 [Aphanomyces astaci]ETV69113.1 hypothetical protein H257_15080 [Aphanomyces astaci]|eukprot:XP_009841366.1 hypothetical protein H257_15080 [Aphanomyces astaci]